MLAKKFMMEKPEQSFWSTQYIWKFSRTIHGLSSFLRQCLSLGLSLWFHILESLNFRVLEVTQTLIHMLSLSFVVQLCKLVLPYTGVQWQHIPFFRLAKLIKPGISIRRQVRRRPFIDGISVNCEGGCHLLLESWLAFHSVKCLLHLKTEMVNRYI